MYNEFGISDKAKNLVLKAEKSLTEEFKKIDDICDINSLKVLKAFNDNKISEAHFGSTTGYGYDDIGRDAIERVFSSVLESEDAIVRSQFISGSHALCVCLFAFLRPGDLMLSITGTPYDTLHEVIGIKENKSSLKSFGIKYDEIDLSDNDFDYEKIENYIKIVNYHIGKLRTLCYIVRVMKNKSFFLGGTYHEEKSNRWFTWNSNGSISACRMRII